MRYIIMIFFADIFIYKRRPQLWLLYLEFAAQRTFYTYDDWLMVVTEQDQSRDDEDSMTKN